MILDGLSRSRRRAACRVFEEVHFRLFCRRHVNSERRPSCRLSTTDPKHEAKRKRDAAVVVGAPALYYKPDARAWGALLSDI